MLTDGEICRGDVGGDAGDDIIGDAVDNTASQEVLLYLVPDDVVKPVPVVLVLSWTSADR